MKRDGKNKSHGLLIRETRGNNVEIGKVIENKNY